jgi:hypothetical protein
VTDAAWAPVRDAVRTTWEGIRARWPDHDVRGAWEALASERGDYRPTLRPEWPFEPIPYTDGVEVFLAMPDPGDEWECPPYWAHVPGSDRFRHPIPMTRRLRESLMAMMG